MEKEGIEENENNEEPNSAVMVGSISVILEKILKNLNAEQLNKCAHVCTAWHEMVKFIKGQSRSFTYHLFHYRSKEPSNMIQHFFCALKDRINCLEPFIKRLNALQNEPSLVMIFSTTTLVCCPLKFFECPTISRKRKLESEEPHFYFCPVIRNILPNLSKKSDVGFFTACGIIGTNSDNSFVKEIQSSPAFSAVCFPSLPGVNIHRFPVSDIGINKSFNFPKLTGIPEGLPIKCLLLFVCNSGRLFPRFYPNAEIQEIFMHYVVEQDCEMAFGGAFINQMCFPRHKERQMHQSYAIAFTGENVEAASVIIKESMNTEAKIIKQLKLLQTSRFPRGQCIALMFTCTESKTTESGVSCDKSKIFRKVFPNIPLFGVFSESQVGINFVPNARNVFPLQYAQLFIEEESATVFVIISFIV